MLHGRVLITCRVWRFYLINVKVKIKNYSYKLFQTTVIFLWKWCLCLFFVYGVPIFNSKEQKCQTCLLINEDLFNSDWFLCLNYAKIFLKIAVWRHNVRRQSNNISESLTNTSKVIRMRTKSVINTFSKINRIFGSDLKTTTSTPGYAGVVGLTMAYDYVREICANRLTVHPFSHHTKDKNQGQSQKFRHLQNKELFTPK